MFEADRLNLESFADRNERLGRGSPRQSELERAMAALERPVEEAEGALEALRLLLVGAIQEEDDYSLQLAVDGLHRLYLIWSGAAESPALLEHRGELRGLHNVASMVLEGLVPLAILAELEPDSVAHQMLVYVAENNSCSNSDLADELEVDKSQISRAGARLHAAGLARARRAGRRNLWEITPRGAQTLSLLATGGKPTPRGRQLSLA
jgi:hypothetical protein